MKYLGFLYMITNIKNSKHLNVFRQMLLSILASLIIISNSTIYANSESKPPKQMMWPFEGLFGKFDRAAAQRGAKVYIEVCSTCHSLNKIYYRNLSALGFSELQIKALAANYNVTDGPNDEGEMFERTAKPHDKFVSPYPNEEAARAANNGAYPVDLSLIVKARHDGANYVYSLLTGYDELKPSNFHLLDGLYYNPYFEGKQIGMPKPLMHNQVEFDDKVNSSVEQMARDVTIFLQWTAEPEMEHRKSLGLKVIMFLIIFTAVFYIAKRRIWSNIKNK